MGGEYPASSTSASEAANENMVKNRGPGHHCPSLHAQFKLIPIVFPSFHLSHKLSPGCMHSIPNPASVGLPGLSILLVWRATGRVSVSNRLIRRWRGASADRLESLFWGRDSITTYSILLPHADDDHNTL